MISTTFLFVTCAFVSVPAIGQGKPTPNDKPTQNVQVVNSAGQPVPTAAQGTTNVAGTVGLAAGTTVNVGNTLDSQNNPTPLAMLEAMQPYEDTCSYSYDGISQSCSFQQVPPGKRLVVQEFDVSQSLETPVKPLSVTLNTGTIAHAFPTTFMGDDGGSFDWFATHQETRLYVQGGATPVCSVRFPSNIKFKGSLGVVSCSLSGFLIDVQQ
jgi:hypothetical protein